MRLRTGLPDPIRQLRDGPNSADPPMTVLFAHHAGGSALSYLPLARWLPAGWRPLGIELPGRVTSDGESSFRCSTDAVAWLLPFVLNEIRGPYALFGHSMGALVGFELVRELTRHGQPPVWLGLSGSPAPGRAGQRYGIRRDLWPQDRLLEFMRELGGTPEAALRTPEITHRMMRTLRDDLAIVDTHQYTAGVAVTVPLSVWVGLDDPVTAEEDLRLWRRHTTAEVRTRGWPGGHFYLFDQAPAVARQIHLDILLATSAAPEAHAQR